MGGALTPNQKWYWQISFNYFRLVLFDMCVPIINMAYFALPSTSIWGHAMTFCHPATLVQDKWKNVEVRGSKKMKWIGPPLCRYRLNWARRTSWGWWDDWDNTVLQTQDSKFEPWRSEAEHALGHGGSPQYWVSHVYRKETFFCFFQTAKTGSRTPSSGVKCSGANNYPRAPGHTEVPAD